MKLDDRFNQHNSSIQSCNFNLVEVKKTFPRFFFLESEYNINLFQSRVRVELSWRVEVEVQGQMLDAKC